MASTSKTTNSVKSSPRGLATFAFLKARFDEQADHIDMFMPLVEDAIANMPTDLFSALEVKKLLHQRHGIVIPQNILITLLNRAKHRGLVQRESGNYIRLNKVSSPNSLQEKKRAIEAKYKQLAEEFRSFAETRKGLDTPKNP